MRALLRRFRPAATTPVDRQVKSVSRTHVGRVRTVNEDRVLDRPDKGLWAVADGMGGHSRGDVAAGIVTECLSLLPDPVTPDSIDSALSQANLQIYERLKSKSGTTLVLLHIDGETAFLRWAGDSRAYLIRQDRLQLLTRDHSIVQELVEAGLLDATQAASHPQANVITQALGISASAYLDRRTITLQAGDRILLCSDGVSRSLNERDVKEPASIALQADRLLANCLQRDGSDNASLILLEVASE